MIERCRADASSSSSKVSAFRRMVLLRFLSSCARAAKWHVTRQPARWLDHAAEQVHAPWPASCTCRVPPRRRRPACGCRIFRDGCHPAVAGGRRSCRRLCAHRPTCSFRSSHITSTSARARAAAELCGVPLLLSRAPSPRSRPSLPHDRTRRLPRGGVRSHFSQIACTRSPRERMYS